MADLLKQIVTQCKKLDPLRAGISLFLSGCMASSFYLWFLQHPVYISKVRIALGMLVCAGLIPRSIL